MSRYTEGADTNYRRELALLPADRWDQEPLVYWLQEVFDPRRDPQDRGMRVVPTENGLWAVHMRPREGSLYFNRLSIVGKLATGGQVAQGLFAVGMHFDPDTGSRHARLDNSCRQYRADLAASTLTEHEVEWDPRTLPLDRLEATGRWVRAEIAETTRIIATDGPQGDPTRDEGAFQLFLDMADAHEVASDLVEAVRQARAA
jgi:hypothetical protein